MESLIANEALPMEKFNKCGELYRSPPLNEKQYMFLSCVYCKSISWDLDNFLNHLDNTHHILDSICLNLHKEEVANEKLLKNAENVMETKIECSSPAKEYPQATTDPLDEHHYDYGDLLPESAKLEVAESNVCARDVNIKIEILKEDANHMCGIHELSSCDYDGDNSSGDDSETPEKNTFQHNKHVQTLQYLTKEENQNDDEDHVADDEYKSNMNLKNLTKNRNLIKHVIKAYEKQNVLWERNKNCSTVARNEALLIILKGINDKFKTSVNLQQIKRLIKYLKFRFMQHLRSKERGESHKNLWFFDGLKFLEPHLKETKMKTGLCKNLNDDQFRLLVKLLRENECFWNENNIYHTSVLKKQEILKELTNNFSKLCNLKDININVMQNTIDEVIVMAKEENLFIMQHMDSRVVCRPSNQFSKELEFLLPHVGPFQCTYCSKTFGDVYAYKFHISKHDGTKPFKCMQCSRELTHKKEFVCHLRRHTKECPFQCNTCEKSFPSQKEWHRHVIKHGSKPYVCELCADSFYTQHQLTNHMKNHNNIRDHVCAECGKGFTHRGLLRQHLQTHNKTKCFCTLCDNIYSNPRSLRKHYVRVHESGQQPTSASLAQYNCQICKITFPTLQDAKQHRKEHKQSNPTERKHVCDICGHNFAYPRNLADHKKTHSNIRDQVCDICGKAFTNANLLNQHKNVHTGEKFVCKACGKDYAHYRGLCRHITKVHATTIRDLDAMLEKQKSDLAPL